MQIDLTGVSMQGFKLLENADYVFDVVKAELGTSNSGNKMFAVTLRERESRTQVYDYLVLNPDNLSKLKTFLCFIGEENEGVVEVDPARWLGKSLRAHTKKEKYNGKESNKIHYYVGPEKGDAPQDEERTRRFKAATSSYASSPSYAADPADAGFPGDDEVPF